MFIIFKYLLFLLSYSFLILGALDEDGGGGGEGSYISFPVSFYSRPSSALISWSPTQVLVNNWGTSCAGDYPNVHFSLMPCGDSNPCRISNSRIPVSCGQLTGHVPCWISNALLSRVEFKKYPMLCHFGEMSKCIGCSPYIYQPAFLIFDVFPYIFSHVIKLYVACRF